MATHNRNAGQVLIILAGCFWGSMGIFVRKLSEYGLSPIQIVALRITVAALAFSLLLLVKDRSGFRIALRKYSPYTVTTYTFLIAAAGSWFVCSPADLISRFAAGNPVEITLFSCLTGLVTAVIPFLAYTLGLRTVEASKAGILATIEPMVATLVGMIVFSEPLTLLSGLGIVLILTAVILLNRKQPAEK
jgi:drug/metabolite transporter (DMT)-like permease